MGVIWFYLRVFRVAQYRPINMTNTTETFNGDYYMGGKENVQHPGFQEVRECCREE